MNRSGELNTILNGLNRDSALRRTERENAGCSPNRNGFEKDHIIQEHVIDIDEDHKTHNEAINSSFGRK